MLDPLMRVQALTIMEHTVRATENTLNNMRLLLLKKALALQSIHI
jgi:hypothetical protein